MDIADKYSISVGKLVVLGLVGAFIACFSPALTPALPHASAMEIDCSSIGGAGGLPAYVESYGVKCSGGGGGSSGSSGGGGTPGCTPNTDKVPLGFFEAFNTGVDDIQVTTRYDSRTDTSTTTVHVYRTDVNGKRYLGGEVTVWSSAGRANSGITFDNHLADRGPNGFYQTAYYNSKMPCAEGMGYMATEVTPTDPPATAGTSPVNAMPLVAPGVVAASGEGPVRARGTLTALGSASDEYVLRVDVTNGNAATRTPVNLSLIMNDFDVESVLASTGDMNCNNYASAVEECMISEMAPGTIQSLTLLLRPRPGASVDAEIPISISYVNPPTSKNGWRYSDLRFYTVSRPGPVVIDPVPTPPMCSTADMVVAGLLSKLTAHCTNGLPMKVVAAHGTASIDAYGNLSYASDPAFRGTDTLTVTASNAHGRVSDPTPVEVVVADPPHAADDTFTVLYGSTFTGSSVLDNDTINGAAASLSPSGWYPQQGSTPPAHGTVVLNRDGTFTYTPNTGFSGTDTFLYRLEGPNNAASNPAKVTLRITVP
jgi:hypothetical protein